MNTIYSENEIFDRKDMIWGSWTFSLSDEQINMKIDSLHKGAIGNSNETEHWKKLFSSFIVHPEHHQSDEETGKITEEVDSPMQCSPIITCYIHSKGEPAESMGTDNTSLVEGLSCTLLDMCNRVAYDLRCGVDAVQKEMCNIPDELNNLSEHSLTHVMDSVWPSLNSDSTKLCFCIPFTKSPLLAEKLCKKILLKWLSKGLPNKLEDWSKILSFQGDVVCEHLIAPLVQIEDSPFVQDVMNLEDIMSSMSAINWTKVLSTLLCELKDLHNWLLPVLSTIVEHSHPSSEDMNLIIHLMSSTGTDFSQNRDFGTLLVNTAICLKSNSASVAQMKIIANNYKLPLKFKALKVLNNINE